jgi:hypothetical protein
MSPAARSHIQKLILWAAPLVALACGGDGGTDVVLPSLRITTATSGVELDTDGYGVSIDGQAAQAIGSNGSLTAEGLDEGPHTVALSGIAANCAVGGDNPRPVNVAAGATLTVAFVITCSPRAGSIQVVTTTTGSGLDPDGFSLLLDASDQGVVGVSATTRLDGVSAGSHMVGLGGIADNCQVSGENPQEVTVPSLGSAEVAFAVTCTAPGPTNGTIQVITRTTGSGIDPDGFSLLLDGTNRGPIGVSETSSLAGVSAGSHTIGLTGLAANCQVTGETSVETTVPGGGTAQVTFDVTCTAPGPTNGTIRVTTTTSGAGSDPDGFSLLLDGADRGPIAVNATSSLAGLTPGSHTIGLTGLAANCQLSGENLRTVTVRAGQTVEAAFAVVCAAPPPTTGTLVIVTATSGLAQDADGYSVSVDGGTNQSIGTSATVRVNNVSAAEHTVQLSGLAANCTVTGSNPRGVVVPAGGTARVNFAITCAATVGSLRVTIEGLPSGAAAAVTVSGPDNFSEAMSATRTLNGLAPGSYTVSAANVVAGGTTYTPSIARPTISVVAGGTAAAAVSYTGPAPASLNLRIDGLYLTQSTQTYTSSIPLVAGRAGYLRVFVVANEANTAKPVVRVTLSRSGAADRVLTVAAPGNQTPLQVQEGTLGSSWNIAIAASLIGSGLSIRAELDPDNDIQESNEGDNRFPVSGSKALLVQAVPDAGIRFVSVQQVSGAVGDVSNPDQLIAQARRLHPLNQVDVDVHSAVFSASAPLLPGTAGEGWAQLVSDLDGLRLTEGSNRTYFGIVKLDYGRNDGLVGAAFQEVPTAAGWDDPGDAGRVVAHELGHTWGRRHSFCGGPPAGTVDALYPYADGKIGVFGFDVSGGNLKAPTVPDIMGYCVNPTPWTSDYTYKGVMSFRASNAAAAAVTAIPQPSLLIRGRIVNGRPVLEPVFQIVTRPSLPRHSGPYTVSATAVDGSRLFSLSFDVATVEDGRAGTGHFAFAVPLDQASVSRLGSLRLEGPTGVASLQASAQVRAGPTDESIIAQREGENVSLRWNAAVHPMIMVRDPDTGEVLSFARGGSASVRTAKGELDLVVSDGVRSHRVRLAINRS